MDDFDLPARTTIANFPTFGTNPIIIHRHLLSDLSVPINSSQYISLELLHISHNKRHKSQNDQNQTWSTGTYDNTSTHMSWLPSWSRNFQQHPISVYDTATQRPLIKIKTSNDKK